MAIRLSRLTLAAAAAGTLVISGLAGTGVALASQNHAWCDDPTPGQQSCMIQADTAPYLAIGFEPGSFTNFADINGTTWKSQKVYEWRADGTSKCMTYDASNDLLILAACEAGEAAQLFWNNQNRLISDGASTSTTNYCISTVPPNGGNNPYIQFLPCNSGTDLWYAPT
jgi:hypothetical protein